MSDVEFGQIVIRLHTLTGSCAMLALEGMYRTIRELHDKTVNAGKAGVSQVSAIEPYPPDWTPVFAHFQPPLAVYSARCSAPVALYRRIIRAGVW